MSLSMEFKGFTGKKKRRTARFENRKLVDEPFKCMVQGDKMNFLNSNMNEDKRKFINSQLKLHISPSSPSHLTIKAVESQAEADSSRPVK